LREPCVVYLSTFSKILSPGIRLGFVVAETSVIQALVLAKQAADLQPNTLIQRAGLSYCRRGFLDRHIPHIIEAIVIKRQACWNDGALFPYSVEWRDPKVDVYLVSLKKGSISDALV